MDANLPLVVDLDGTLTLADTLFLSVIKLVRHFPLYVFCLPFWLLMGRAALKGAVALRSPISATKFPYNESFLAYLRSEKARGRRIVLATAAHQLIADKVSAHLGLFDDVLASNSSQNLKGRAKLELIKRRVGEKFVYAGDSKADLPIWLAANAAILVGVRPSLADAVRRKVRIECEFPI